jgi:hypothetical protein
MNDVPNRTAHTIQAIVHQTNSDPEPIGSPFVAPRDSSSYESSFHSDYNLHLKGTAFSYRQYLSAYRYGYALGCHWSQSGRTWRNAEDDVRQGWEFEHKDKAWGHFKPAIQYGWNYARGKS